MAIGGNSPITNSCNNGGTVMNINTGGTVHSNSGTVAPFRADATHSNSGTVAPFKRAVTVHSNSGTVAPFSSGGVDKIPLPTFS
jgi:hypothetical protein